MLVEIPYTWNLYKHTTECIPDTAGVHDDCEVGECVITILCLNCSGKSFVKQDKCRFTGFLDDGWSVGGLLLDFCVIW